MNVKRFISHALQLVFILLCFNPTANAKAINEPQGSTPQARARALLNHLSPEERVGQLFLVTFQGLSAASDTQIYDLIVRHHIGGVILLATNDNFDAAPNTITEAYRLLTDLQTAEWQGSQSSFTNPVTGEQIQGAYIPLLLGISQEGDGYPTDQILSGLTQMPNQMALGATWQPLLVEQSGTVVGQELSALGFNIFLGPSLDVLETPTTASGGGLGIRVFGGDPYWVGEMGKAYITGIHRGSNNKIIVVSKYFPGRGGSDRPAGEEVATVRKSLEQLKQIELAPFFAVTSASNSSANTDGLLVSHIRYQGFQGNIRATTRPVSFDQQALSQILGLPSFSTWYENGGLIVSDDLGSQAVRKFYAPGGQSFSARLVARDAFLAGNDLLYLGNVISSDVPDNYSTVLKVLEFFAQKYKEDPAFAQRVDNSVLRILTVKYRIYNNFMLSQVIPPAEGLENIGNSETVTFVVAREAATLISPDLSEMDAVLPEPPNIRDRLLFITDTRLGRQCSTCPEQPLIPIDAFQNAVLNLYGPTAGGQVSPSRLISYSFADLELVLTEGGYPSFESNLQNSDWVILSMLDADPNKPETIILRRFLSDRQDLLRNKRVILFSFNAPYYLDATDISKLTAYYGLYSKTHPFLEVAARLLFKDLSTARALPVSVPGIGYDLLTATTPDPKQLIELYLDLPASPTSPTPLTPQPTTTPVFRVGDTVSVHTGTILDHNQNPVPDGTGVQFILHFGGESGTTQQIDAATIQGIARASFRIERVGMLEIRATSEPAIASVALQMNITDEGVSVTVLAPTATPESITPTPPSSLPIETENGIIRVPTNRPNFGSWFISMLTLIGAMFLANYLGKRFHDTRWGLRWALGVALGGLFAYNYLALGMPGSQTLIQNHGNYGILGTVLLGITTGWVSIWAWLRLVNAHK